MGTLITLEDRVDANHLHPMMYKSDVNHFPWLNSIHQISTHDYGEACSITTISVPTDTMSCGRMVSHPNSRVPDTWRIYTKST